MTVVNDHAAVLTSIDKEGAELDMDHLSSEIKCITLLTQVPLRDAMSPVIQELLCPRVTKDGIVEDIKTVHANSTITLYRRITSLEQLDLSEQDPNG